MDKKQLVEKIQAECGLQKNKIEEVLDGFTTVIKKEFAHKDNKLSLRGFGFFESKHKPARTARNPKTGEPVQVAAKQRVTFKTSSSFFQ